MEIKQQKRDVFRDARGLRKTKNQFSLALNNSYNSFIFLSEYFHREDSDF